MSRSNKWRLLAVAFDTNTLYDGLSVSGSSFVRHTMDYAVTQQKSIQAVCMFSNWFFRGVSDLSVIGSTDCNPSFTLYATVLGFCGVRGQRVLLWSGFLPEVQPL